MCGRFSLYLTYKELLEIFRLDAGFPFAPRFNIAPAQEVVAIRREEGRRCLVLLRWGLIPFWAEDAKMAYRTINARAETAHKVPSFRHALRRRRCLIPASGFFEWRREGKLRQPFFIHRKDRRPMALAGLWEEWQDNQGEGKIATCTILTTRANRELAGLHERMPVLLEAEDFDLWLDPEEGRLEQLQPLLKPAADGLLHLYPVSPYVNSPSHEGERCIEEAARPEG